MKGLLRSGLRSGGCAVVVGAVGIVGAGACAGGGGSDGGAASTSVAASASTSSAPAEVTATVTSTVTASPEKRAPSPERSAPPPAPPSTSSALGAEATVVAYFDAVNALEYRAAWELGGKNLAGDYEAFVDGFTGTERDTVRILGVAGDTVRAELEALQSDGSLKVFEGTYTVRSGVITAADVREVEGPEDATPPSDDPAESPSPSYENCDAAEEAGAAPLITGEPGYGDHLDRDGDGVACEPYIP
ncbi:excalibur calcium-binding domain-containing protein [Streptomyces cyaneofuscatus]|uniref:Excalibur calcium-binding domain-containing protein n=1 Tax=Streptomyces cyaneofuscatus TaxID=66883 RepID=A0ABZ1EYB6_9ACTN|nr:excalibur calcium-binding domain-containing protein [Streptomyces cyaneofuscatus]WSB09028.1 excalibur calcium-binding domain-containing protein [Streptomyces cyaneofuscatus]WSD47438.1 excalibur calcium-binding domain-containing protein [Streptomyces cyaneofuscatus]